MPIVKTGVSLEQDLLERATELARALRVSRSELISVAVRSYLRDYENKLIFERLQAVYGHEADAEERQALAEMRRHFHDTVENVW